VHHRIAPLEITRFAVGPKKPWPDAGPKADPRNIYHYIVENRREHGVAPEMPWKPGKNLLPVTVTWHRLVRT
jgi:hypothetical protein